MEQLRKRFRAVYTSSPAAHEIGQISKSKLNVIVKFDNRVRCVSVFSAHFEADVLSLLLEHAVPTH